MMIRWWWLLAVSAGFAQVSFNISPRVVAINEYVQFQVVVEGKGGAIPHFPNGFVSADFELVRSSPNQQTNMTMINGNVSHKVLYTYYLSPKREGDLVLEPQTVSMDGREYQSPKTAVDVGPEDTSVGSQRRRSDPFGDFFGRRRRQTTTDEKAEIFTEAEVPKTSYFVGEPIPYTLNIYRTPGVEISNSGSQMELPDFTNFWSEELESRQDPVRVRKDGKILERITVDKRQLFASKTGPLRIPPADFRLTVAVGRGFFADWQTVTRNSNEVNVTVNPLPEAGKPAGFSGAVGNFSISGSLDKTEIGLGESVSFKVEVSGRGNFNAINDLTLNDLKGAFEVFDGGAPTVDKTKGVTNTKTWVFALVPKREGTFEVPLPQISYFDLNTESYRTTEARTYTIDVKGGEGLTASGPVGGDRAPLLASQNLNYIMQGPMGARDMGQTLLSPRPLYWLAGAMLVLNLMVIAGRLMRAQLAGSLAQSRPKLALKNCLKTMDRLASESDHEAFHAGLSQAVFAYFGDKWGRAAQGISLEDILAFFNRKAMDESLTAPLVDVVETCDRARFTPASPASREHLLNQAREVVRNIDEVMA